MRTGKRPFTGSGLRLVLFGSCAFSAFGLQAQHPGTMVIREFFAPTVDMIAIVTEDSIRASHGALALYGRLLPMDVDMTRDAVLFRSGEEGVRRIRVVSPGAQALELFYEDMRLAVDATFSIYSDEGVRVLGPYGAAELGAAATFSTPLVMGEACVVELRTSLDDDRSNFRIQQLGHAYRDVLDGACNVDVNCSPEGDLWDAAVAGTVRISVVVPAGVGWCSGALVNNVRQDCRPFILTAWHCGATSTSANFASYKFYFGYQRSGCGSGTASGSQFVTGAQLRAYSDDNAGNAGSDFMLLETNNAIPPAFEPFWTGWDATAMSTSAADGVCIHHPTGSPKRVSTYTQTLTTGHWAPSTGLQSHWRVNWVATPNGHGIAESGSSGGPLFKRDAMGNPLIIGTLSGSINQLSCSNPISTSFFGKLSYHWTGNPNSQSQKLKQWLDPDNTGALVLTGSEMPCAAEVGMMESTNDRIVIFPNPASDQLIIQHAATDASTRVQVLDHLGRVVGQFRLSTQERSLINTSGWSAGVYFLQFFTSGDQSFTSRFILAP